MCQVVLGDCLDVLSGLEPDRFSLTLTDIPYSVVSRESNGLRNFDKSKADVKTFELAPFIKECARVTSGSMYIFCSTEQVSEVRSLMIEEGMSTRLCIWEKTNPSPMNGQHIWLSSIETCVYGKYPKATYNRHCESPVWRFPTTRSKIHPTQKPVKLFEYIIESSSIENDVVFDPCAGSGTTAIAAQNTNRQYFLIEKDEEYYNSIIDRIKTSSSST